LSTTNPDHGRPPADPVGGLAPIRPGSPRADDHDVSGPPSPETIARGHEVDHYDTTSVFSVPLLVVLFFVLAFGTVSVIFYFIFPSPDDPNAHPMAAADNKKALTERREEVPEPRIDNFRQLQGNSRSMTSGEKATGNSPLLHPEDIRVNPTNTPTLYQSGWLTQNKSHARITIDDAIDVAAKNKDAILKISKSPVKLTGSSNVPTASNGGRGDGPSTAPPPKGPTEAKPPEGKK
jgi:hypothetical protein